MVGIALDTKGPEIRTGTHKEGDRSSVQLTKGDVITVTVDPKYKKECRDFEKPHDRMSNAELLMEWHSLTEAAKEEYAEAP